MGFEPRRQARVVTGAWSGIGRGWPWPLRGRPRSGSAPVGRTAWRGAAQCTGHTRRSHRWWIGRPLPWPASSSAGRDAVDALGGVDVLVNNAGIPKRRQRPPRSVTVEAVIKINYVSPVQLTLALLPDARGGEGRVVNVRGGGDLSSPGERRTAHPGRAVGRGRRRWPWTSGMRDQGDGRLPGRRGHRAVPPARQRPVHRQRRVDHGRGVRRPRVMGRPSPRTISSVYVPEWFAAITTAQGHGRRCLPRRHCRLRAVAVLTRRVRPGGGRSDRQGPGRGSTPTSADVEWIRRQPRWRPVLVRRRGGTADGPLELCVRGNHVDMPLIFPLDHEMRLQDSGSRHGIPAAKVHGWIDDPTEHT